MNNIELCQGELRVPSAQHTSCDHLYHFQVLSTILYSVNKVSLNLELTVGGSMEVQSSEKYNLYLSQMTE